jgi:hypothetical protein
MQASCVYGAAAKHMMAASVAVSTSNAPAS